MRANVTIGEVVIHVGAQDYLLRPSFAALAALDPIDKYQKDVTTALALLETGVAVTPELCATCAEVLRACCTTDLPASVLGDLQPRKSNPAQWWKHRHVLWGRGKMQQHDLIVLANHMIKWGIVGDAKTAKRRARSKGPARAFDIREFHGAAVAALGIQPSEAWQLTMAEFQAAMDIKFPPDPAKELPTEDEVRDTFRALKIPLQSKPN